MADGGVFDFCEARESFNKVVQTVADQNSLEPYHTFVQECPASDSEKRVTVDQSFRDVLRQLSSANKGCEVYQQFICLAIEAVQGELCSSSVPFLLLTDIFDVIPLDQCEILFNLLEDKVRIWKSPTFYDTGKNFLLRMCNDLLRRLSKSQNTVFCGRIQLFLSRLFPLAEKSALNLMSQFNLENETHYTQPKKEPETTAEGGSADAVKQETMDVDEKVFPDNTSDNPIDYDLYRKFWALQDFFRKPVQCYEKKLWATFTANADAVFAAFTSSKLDDVQSKRKKDLAAKTTQIQPDDFFAKYLTSEKLLNLQLNDSNFRRYVLVQFLIIFQYLNAPVKFKTNALTLTDDQNTWLKTSTELIYNLIRETPPEGEKFAKIVERLLEREEHWNRWKNNGCPDFEKKSVDDDSSKRAARRPKKRRVGDDIQITGGKIIKMGNPELTKLWNLNPNNMEACKAPDRMFLPTLEDFFQEAIEQNDPEQHVEEEYKSTNDPTFQWKALRLLARRSPQFFTNSTTPALELKVYINGMLSMMAKQMPREGEEMRTEVEDEEEIKATQDEEVQDLKQSDEAADDKDGDWKEIILNKHIIRSVGEKVGNNWKKLATELSFPDEDITYFESQGGSEEELAVNMLTIWMENDPEHATADTLKLALKEVGMQEISDTLTGPS